MTATIRSFDPHAPVLDQSRASSPQSCLVHVLTQCVSSHVLSGLCKIGGYEILRHGTSWSNYKSILKTGVDLDRGGRTTEDSTDKYVTCTEVSCEPDGRKKITVTRVLRSETECAHNRHAVNAKGKFYVFRDSKLGIDQEGHRVISRCTSSVYKRFGPIQHSTLAYLAQYVKESTDGEQRGWMIVAAFIKAIFTPKLKFIYSLQEIEGHSGREALFEKDPDYSCEGAYRTSQSLPNDRIGMAGFFTHADRAHMWKHIKENPGKLIQGIIQLVIGIFLTLIPGLGFLT